MIPPAPLGCLLAAFPWSFPSLFLPFPGAVEESPQWEIYLAFGSAARLGALAARSPLARLGGPYVPAVTCRVGNLEANHEFITLNYHFSASSFWLCCKFEEFGHQLLFAEGCPLVCPLVLWDLSLPRASVSSVVCWVEKKTSGIAVWWHWSWRGAEEDLQ